MRAAIIGCGRMGAEPSERLRGKIPAGWLPISHAEAIQAVEDLDLLALCDTNQDLLKQRSEYYKINAIYTDYRQLIDEMRPDILTIATRTPIKKEIIQYACQHGVKGIYVEKPMANSLQALQECFSEIRKHNVKLIYGVNRRYHLLYRHAKKLIQQGMIGNIKEVVIENGQSALLWSHPHSVDLILFFLNKTNINTVQANLVQESVHCKEKLEVDSDPIIEHAFFKFLSGETAVLSRADGCNVKITGSDGSLVVHADGAFIQINRRNKEEDAYFQKQEIVNVQPNQSATVIAFSELVEAIQEKKSLPISLEEIEVGTKMLFSCVWSHLNENKNIIVNDLPETLCVTGKYKGSYA